ncbi:hypothetical protein Bbelb_232950 [Branchiostoma belcheri]|nr:hypothetical protein Bbelb_232950 [Branchiostoma belcheri]
MADESEAAPGTMRSVSQWRGGDWGHSERGDSGSGTYDGQTDPDRLMDNSLPVSGLAECHGQDPSNAHKFLVLLLFIVEDPEVFGYLTPPLFTHSTVLPPPPSEQTIYPCERLPVSSPMPCSNRPGVVEVSARHLP